MKLQRVPGYSSLKHRGLLGKRERGSPLSGAYVPPVPPKAAARLRLEVGGEGLRVAAIKLLRETVTQCRR
jgi:hypothetical protein